MAEQPPITHAPHAICVIYKHDSLNVVVTMAICDEGRCLMRNSPRGYLVDRYRAAGMEAADFPPSPHLRFWLDHEVLRTMAYLKLALYEGRQTTIEWARGRLVQLATEPRSNW